MNGTELKYIRQQNGNLTQTELADRLGVTLRTIQAYEKSNNIPTYMQKLIHHEFIRDVEKLEEKLSSASSPDALSIMIDHYKDKFDPHDYLLIKEEIKMLEQYKTSYEQAKMSWIRKLGILSR